MNMISERQVGEMAPHLLKRVALFLAVAAAAIFAGLLAVLKWVAYANANESASHVVLVPFVSIVLVWMNRSTVFATTNRCWSGLAVLGTGLAVVASATLGILPGGEAGAMFWPIGGIVVAWAGTFLLVFGRAAFKAALFPLVFLVFAIPLPEPAVAEVVRVLKTGSADAVALLFGATGTPHLRSGFVFELPGFVIEIADECSGVRSSIALTLTTLLAGHLFLESPSRKTILVLLVLPVAILKNAIRIVTLSLLAIHVDPTFLVGQLHHDGGVLFFLLALALLTPILSMLRASETRWRGLRGVLHPSTR
jgi:exosortase